MTKSAIRVLVVDDYKAWRNLLSTTLQKELGLQVIGQVSDGPEAVQQARELQPELILLDIGLPTLNGIEAARQIRKASPASKILFVSENRSPDVVKEALSTGANGYLLKSNVAHDLSSAVQAVLQGKQFVSASLARHHLVTPHTQASENPYLRFVGSAFIAEFLASVIAATAADFGNVQLFDSTHRVLRLVAHHGFEPEFLNYFNTVSCDDQCVCAAAMHRRSRMVVADVVTDLLLSNESREVLLRANVRSVQSTPLIDSCGQFIGMVSTHYCRAGGVTAEVLQTVDDSVAGLFAKIKA